MRLPKKEFNATIVLKLTKLVIIRKNVREQTNNRSAREDTFQQKIENAFKIGAK